MVSETSERRGSSLTEKPRAAQLLGRSRGHEPAVIRREEVEELGRLGDHLRAPFGRRSCTFRRSMNLICSKLIERIPRLSNKKMRNSAIIAVTVR
jgi:hypothetical protein